MDKPGGTVVIDRTSAQDIKMRELFVQVDELPEASLKFGQSLELPLAEGTHRVKVTNRLTTQRAEFAVRRDEIVRFDAANVPAGAFFAPLLALGAGGYKVSLKRI